MVVCAAGLALCTVSASLLSEHFCVLIRPQSTRTFHIKTEGPASPALTGLARSFDECPQGLCGTPWAALRFLIHSPLQAELRELQPVLEQTAKDVEAMMVQITADKQEADVTQKRVAKQEQEADEQAAKVRAAVSQHNTCGPVQSFRIRYVQLWQQVSGSSVLSSTCESQCSASDPGVCSFGSK